MRLLLAEDDALNAELFAAVLVDEGHEVVVEGDGIRARDRGLAEAFDLYILDVQLPGLDGHAICRALRRAGVRVPIIAASALAMPDQVERGLAAGFDEYLTKPLAPATLRAAVQRHVAKG